MMIANTLHVCSEKWEAYTRKEKEVNAMGVMLEMVG